MVDDAVGWGKKEVNHSGQHHGGNEVRHIDRSLGKSLEALAVQLIQQDGQYDRDGETEQQAVEVQQKSVQEHSSAVIAAKEFFKMFQAYPGASLNFEYCLIILECDLDTVHGEVTEDNKENQTGEQQYPQLPVPAQGHSYSVPDPSAISQRG